MEEEHVSPAYQKGYNHGYELSGQEPELLDRLINSGQQDHDYFRALEAGDRQRQKDRMVEQMKQQTRQLGKDKGKGL
ncbi:hypothetical protein LZF95_19505 [Algoriphagus sp. AGSA1]|uniref:hypothetical protein n=1 Tax=Algoriphagus sp. AGSA1 TaxID=2907213 RepID=UPI001F1C6C78|nr:hypothetical protein [Algoriphagus sp. AGSA1]MCE7056875.1 hypothetical protein [Algoriphagus sp. AGSA1]